MFFFYSFDNLNSLLRLWLINQKGIYVPMAFQHCVLFLLASDLQIRKQIKGERGKGSLYMPFIVHHYLEYERPGKKIMLLNMYSNILCFSFSHSSNGWYAKNIHMLSIFLSGNVKSKYRNSICLFLVCFFYQRVKHHIKISLVKFAFLYEISVKKEILKKISLIVLQKITM